MCASSVETASGQPVTVAGKPMMVTGNPVTVSSFVKTVSGVLMTVIRTPEMTAGGYVTVKGLLQRVCFLQKRHSAVGRRRQSAISFSSSMVKLPMRLMMESSFFSVLTSTNSFFAFRCFR